jgi:hypothetical protein
MDIQVVSGSSFFAYYVVDDRYFLCFQFLTVCGSKNRRHYPCFLMCCGSSPFDGFFDWH